MTKLFKWGKSKLTLFLSVLPHLTFFIAGVIIGLAMLNLYHQTYRNLVLQNIILENEIADYLEIKCND
jgi:hypothetical protein